MQEQAGVIPVESSNGAHHGDITLGECHNNGAAGCLAMSHSFTSLRHHTIICCCHQYHLQCVTWPTSQIAGLRHLFTALKHCTPVIRQSNAHHRRLLLYSTVPAEISSASSHLPNKPGLL